MAVTINASTSAGLVNTADTSGVLELQTAGTTAVTVDASQNVGIGTATPGYKLDVQSSASSGAPLLANFQAAGGDVQVYIQNGTVKTQITADATNSASIIGSFSNHPLSLRTNNVERMRISAAGDLLVGTTSQVSQGKGNIAFNGSSHQGFNLQETANQSSAGFMYFQHNTTVLGTITRNGLTSAVQYNTTSDIRLKENIENANSALTTISNIKVRQYDWIGCEDSHQDYGFIAQELVEVVSGIVTKGRTEEDIWAVDYGKLTPILCKAIQEQQALITALTARIEALENK